MNFGKITGAMALTLAVASVPAMALNTRSTRTTTSQARQSGAMFNRLDTNRDGVISRSEWPRDAAAFDRIDMNRDGLITQAEAQNVFGTRQNGKAKGNRFRGMDRNGDGVITRDEWRGNDQSFQQHDRNRDGVLSGDEMRGNGNGQWKQNGDDDRNESHQSKGHGKKSGERD